MSEAAAWWLAAPERWFNLGEALLWFALAVVLRWRGQGPTSRLAAGLLLLFGGSDLVEAHTGSWWEPWWLLGWKATCVAGLVACWWRIRAPASPR